MLWVKENSFDREGDESLSPYLALERGCGTVLTRKQTWEEGGQDSQAEICCLCCRTTHLRTHQSPAYMFLSTASFTLQWGEFFSVLWLMKQPGFLWLSPLQLRIPHLWLIKLQMRIVSLRVASLETARGCIFDALKHIFTPGVKLTSVENCLQLCHCWNRCSSINPSFMPWKDSTLH